MMKNHNIIKRWNIALESIIGGNGLISKRPSRYSPNNWPTFYKKAIGSNILSIENKWFIDFSEFSIGCNLYGYAPNHLRFLPLKYCFSSPLSSLNSKYELLLAEELNKALNEDRIWKFTRGGGEALSLAIRYSRTMRKKGGPILVTGYHGWHDWYLAANLKKESLDDLLIAGLPIDGVPKELKSTIFACKIEDLENSINIYNPSVIVYEGSRSDLLDMKTISILNKFKKEGGIIIADEITSGFRTKEITFSKRYKLKADIIILGKALGSGYAISSVGCIKNKENKKLLNVFASSTFWTEEIGLKAAYLNVRYFRKNRHKIIKVIERNCTNIREILIDETKKNDFDIEINSHPTMIYSKIYYKNCKINIIKSILCSLMVDKGIIFSNNIYPSYAHNNRNILRLKQCLGNSLKETKKILDSKTEEEIIKEFGEVNEGFERLTK